MTDDPLIRINDLRAKVAAGERLSQEEVAEAVKALRTSRAAMQPKAKPVKEKTLPTNLNDLFAPKPDEEKDS